MPETSFKPINTKLILNLDVLGNQITANRSVDTIGVYVGRIPTQQNPQAIISLGDMSVWMNASDMKDLRDSLNAVLQDDKCDDFPIPVKKDPKTDNPCERVNTELLGRPISRKEAIGIALGQLHEAEEARGKTAREEADRYGCCCGCEDEESKVERAMAKAQMELPLVDPQEAPEVPSDLKVCAEELSKLPLDQLALVIELLEDKWNKRKYV